MKAIPPSPCTLIGTVSSSCADWRDAARIATILGHADDARRFEKFLNEYRTAMYDSMRRSIELHGISYAPGCAELGDFDATSTAIGIAPCGELGHIPEPELHQTFERYFDFFTKRRDGVEPWRDYTPYELRLVGAFVRLGQRERAAELLDFFFQHQLPPGWMHWAEVVPQPAKHAGVHWRHAAHLVRLRVPALVPHDVRVRRRA